MNKAYVLCSIRNLTMLSVTAIAMKKSASKTSTFYNTLSKQLTEYDEWTELNKNVCI